MNCPNRAVGHQRLHLTGHYETVWRKTGHGWKFIADMGTTDPQPKKR